jgi:sulfur carrier protein
LLDTLGLSERPVAVERNADIVPRAQHASTRLHEGDKLEVVQFVGGG